jgi:hypothetical protein
MSAPAVLVRRVAVGELNPGDRFRFQEEGRRAGYPYLVVPIPTRYRGERKYFDEGELPIVIRRMDGNYPPYGAISGFFPVKNDEGRAIYWVAHPHTEVLAPTRLALRLQWGFVHGLLALIAILAALAASYWLISTLR